jgi:hypothetical protein
MMAAPLLGVALSAASSVASFAAEQQAVNAHNQATAQAHLDARWAAANKYTDEGRKFRYDAKSLRKEGYKAAVAGREAIATATASAGSSGIASHSVSLKHIINAEKRKTGDNMANIEHKYEDMRTDYINKVKNHQTEAQARINSMPFKEGPNPLGLIIGIAGGLAKGVAG